MTSPRTRDLIVVGVSAGGAEALQAFVSGLPADLPAFARERGGDTLARRYEKGAHEATFAADVLRQYLTMTLPEHMKAES